MNLALKLATFCQIEGRINQNYEIEFSYIKNSKSMQS